MEITLFLAVIAAAAVLQTMLCRRAKPLWLRVLPAALCAAMLLYGALRFFGVIVYPGDAGMLFDRGFTTGILLSLVGLACCMGIAAAWAVELLRNWRKKE